jgi:hypothetical protein
MALRDWVRNDGFINSTPEASPQYREDSYILLIRDIQYQDIQNYSYMRFPTLYDIASANKGKNYIPVTDNTKLIQDPPNPAMVNSFRKNNP